MKVAARYCGDDSSRLRILLLAPDCNPERVSVPLVAYQHAVALARLHKVTLVAKSSVEGALRRSKAPFSSIEIVRTPTLDRIFSWVFRSVFRNNYDSQALTAFTYPFAVGFEWCSWLQLRHRILAGEFDVVIRLIPVTAVLPSPFAFFLRKGSIPFVVGPINGGLPWPPGFSQLVKQREWIAGLRNIYRFLPFARSTFRHAAAIIVASSHTYSEFIRYRDKLFFIPENGIDHSLCCGDSRPGRADGKLDLIFVGGLVPRKACDLALRGAARLLRAGLAQLTILGDGPERNRLEELAKSLGVEEAVTFEGWVSHGEVLNRMRSSDVLVFPSLRDFGGGVVFEALAVGAVPVVVDFGGPGDIVTANVGYKVSIHNEGQIVSEIEAVLKELAENPDLLTSLRQEGVAYARRCLTWDAKAADTTRVLNWVLHRGAKPDLLPPRISQPGISAEPAETHSAGSRG